MEYETPFTTEEGGVYGSATPPPYWDDQQQAPPPPPRSGPDLTPLFAIVEALRRGLPRDVQGQFTSLLREVLLTMRSLIDWYLERLDRAEKTPEVEDIPID